MLTQLWTKWEEFTTLWRDDYGYSFCLRLSEYTGDRLYLPQTRMSYKFWHRGQLIFSGDDFGCSPLHAIDSIECVASMLHFLSLRPGDTDKEYFDSYSPAQLEWANQWGEELSLIANELEGN